MDKTEQEIAHNIKTHDRVARRYERIHTEIYNDIEQTRLKRELTNALSLVQTNTSGTLTVFDFGCGAGNLSRYVLEQGARVVAGDVSQGFLDLVNSKFISHKSQLETMKLNGKNLSNIPDNSYDMVMTYSVLHHIPDYLHAVSEMIRVLKPGGILFIDHERNENYWNPDLSLRQYRNMNKWRMRFRKLPRILSSTFYISRYKRIKNPRYQHEGDIHVFHDDHIQWNKVEQVLSENECKVVYKNDYLLYDGLCSEAYFDDYKNTTSDTRLLIAQKCV